MKKPDEEIVIELPESTLDALLSPLGDTGSSAGSVPQNAIMQSMMLTGKNVPFPCYKRSNGSNHAVLRVITQPASSQ